MGIQTTKSHQIGSIAAEAITTPQLSLCLINSPVEGLYSSTLLSSDEILSLTIF